MKQVVIALKLAGVDGPRGENIMKSVLPGISEVNTSESPAHFTTIMHRRLREALGADPFLAIKSEYNRKALAIENELGKIVKESADPLFTAARIAIAGNIIDFGIFSSIDMKGTLRRALGGPLAVDDYDDFKREIEKADDVLYLCDNAGEIVFDKILIRALAAMGKRVTACVKGSAIINDAVLEDAREAGLISLCEVMDNGSDCVGTILQTTSPAFNGRFERAGLVISKGQGNFETLMGLRKNIFFLFQSKCEVVSKFLGLPLGAMLLARAARFW